MTALAAEDLAELAGIAQVEGFTWGNLSQDSCLNQTDQSADNLSATIKPSVMEPFDLSAWDPLVLLGKCSKE